MCVCGGVVLPRMKSKDLSKVVLTLTCNSFTTVLHIVRGVTPSDCGTQIRHMKYDYRYKTHEKILVYSYAPNMGQPALSAGQDVCLCNCKYLMSIKDHCRWLCGLFAKDHSWKKPQIN